MAIDVSDPFRAHAVFALEFVCAVCGDTLLFQSTHAFASDEYFGELADMARKAGWFCPPPNPDGTVDVMTCYCPRHPAS